MIGRFVKQQLERQSRVRWAMEIVGVGCVAVAAAMWIVPLGIVVIGSYLIIAANMEGDSDASTRPGS